jgi:hypothetical protein
MSIPKLCPTCGSSEQRWERKPEQTHIGVWCARCGKWFDWVKKSEESLRRVGASEQEIEDFRRRPVGKIFPSKWSGKCPLCDDEINEGDDIYWEKDKKNICIACHDNGGKNPDRGAASSPKSSQSAGTSLTKRIDNIVAQLRKAGIDIKE